MIRRRRGSAPSEGDPTIDIRPTAVAGTFYPADAGALTATIDEALAEGTAADPTPVSTRHPAPSDLRDGERPPKALIAPHAGYVYSGPIAGSAYALAAPLRGVARRVVLLGPAHRVPVVGMAVPTTSAFATPLGPVALDEELRRVALGVAGVHADDRPHGPEHSLEVHLPFLLRVLGPDITVLPVVVGDASPEAVADLLDAVWGGPETLIVVSSDLSHYHDHATATSLDRRTALAIVDLRVGAIGPHDACGAAPVNGLLLAARRRGLTADLLDLRTSGDTAGDRERVVGYGAFALSDPG